MTDILNTNYAYFVERTELYPEIDDILYQLKKSQIISLLEDTTLHTTFHELSENYNFSKDNFKHIIKRSFVLTNNEAESFLKSVIWVSMKPIIEKQKIIPIDAFNYYVANYVFEHETVTFNCFIIAYRINTDKVPKNFEKICNYRKMYLDNGKITKDDAQFIQYFLTQLKYDYQNKYHFGTTTNLIFKDLEKKIIEQTVLSSNKTIEQPSFLNYELRDYQKADIAFMLKQEKKSSINTFSFDRSEVCFWNSKNKCIIQKNINEMGVVNYEFKIVPVEKEIIEHSDNSFNGGCLCNDSGLGKTLEMLTLCGLAPSLNLVVVPDHLLDHWIDEYKKHIKTGIKLIVYINDHNLIKTNFEKESIIILVPYKKMKLSTELFKLHFTRLIIDEFDELISLDNKTKLHNLLINYAPNHILFRNKQNQLEINTVTKNSPSFVFCKYPNALAYIDECGEFHISNKYDSDINGIRLSLTKSIFENVKSQHKWAIAKGNFNHNMIYNLLKMITNNNFNEFYIQKYNLDIICKAFRKNTIEQVKKELTTEQPFKKIKI
jgi:hypothetical protein